MTRQYGGAGLGLSISNSLVALMGGRLYVESRSGFGSTFRFSVRLQAIEGPSEDRETTIAAVGGVPSGDTRPLRILLAEDTPANQKLIARVLQKCGHRVDVADNGQKAIDLLRQVEFDVVLMDMQMPVMDGLEATTRIRALPDASKAKVPIIAITAHAREADREQCLAAGMDDYLTKPVNLSEMTQAIERLTGRNARPNVVSGL
jgi:CheY-like chemotaxis protein